MICENIFLTQDLSQIDDRNLHLFGLLVTANKPVDHVPQPINDGHWWILDNGAFTKKGFDESHWFEWMEALEDFDDTCICVVIPDVVGDCQATIDKFKVWNGFAYNHFSHVAFVTQDGLKTNMVPWDDFDVLFIGGTDHHKMGIEAAYLIEEGLNRGKHIHVGRVNTEFRLMHFWRCHTWDGTAVTIKPEKYEPIIVEGVKAVIERKNSPQMSLF